ncbi:Endonuclease/exonuclease/phosphatase [Trinorchestia longiramus]|nr:Endonuclease/exonuclease/phosphatase [Trinorchestia longiramus]
MPELQTIALTLSHDIIAVNETWLDLNGRHLPAEVSMKGYVLHNIDKPSHNNRGGGSLIYIKEKLQSQIKTKRATKKSEILHLTIQPHPGQTSKIVLVYRNPTCTAIEDDEFYDCLDNILSSPHETLIIGDLNLPHINWTTRQSQAPGSKLIDLMNTNSLQQHVNDPTRGNNILDLVMTTTYLSINGSEVTDKIGDHQMIDFSLDVQDPNTRTQHKQVLDYKRENLELMKEELGSHNYQVIMNNKNAENVTWQSKKRLQPLQNTISQASESGQPITFLGSHKRLNASSILTSVVSKTLERLLKVRITKHLNDQNLINDTQHGFREKRSCLTNLLDFFGDVNLIYDRTKVVNLVYVDFQKTFDKVPRKRLMTKVEAHGIRGNYSRWIRNWLTGRTQRVMIHDQASDSTLVTSGVPQGSILGPLLFIICINDLDVRIISKINKFADDTELSHRAFTERDRVTIQSDLNRLEQWIEPWQMSFNFDKCSVIHVCANN